MLFVYMILLTVLVEEGLGARNSRIVRVKQGKLQGIVVGEFTSRLYTKVGYSRCAPMYGKCRLLR